MSPWPSNRRSCCFVGGVFVLEALSVILQSVIPLNREAHFPDVSAAPSFRAGGMERIENHRAVLDRGFSVALFSLTTLKLR